MKATNIRMERKLSLLRDRLIVCYTKKKFSGDKDPEWSGPRKGIGTQNSSIGKPAKEGAEMRSVAF